METWKPIPGYEADYEISSLGTVKRLTGNFRGRMLHPEITRHGYQRVVLSSNAISRKFMVHRLVMLAFCGGGGNLDVNHKNGNKADNSIDNLEYLTKEENHRHASAIGLKARGSRHGNVKLTAGQVLEIRRSVSSDTVLSIHYGVSRATIWQVRNNRSRYWAWV